MDMVDWISDDICFCRSDCENKECMRNPVNIRNPKGLHSFAYLKDTELCPITNTKK